MADNLLPPIIAEVAADVADFKVKMDEVSAKLDDLGSKDTIAKVRVDTGDADVKLAALNREVQSSGDGLETWKKIAIGIASTLVPIGAVVGGLSVGLIGLGATAGIGLGAFALAIKPVVANISAASTAQANYNKALSTYGPNSSQAKTAQLQLNAAVAQLSPQARAASTALTNAKASYQGWAQALAPQTIPVFTQALSLVAPALSELTPIVQGASAGLKTMLQTLGQFLTAPAMVSALRQLGQSVQMVFSNLGYIIGPLVQTLLNFVNAAAPFVRIILGLLQDLVGYLSQVNFSQLLAPLLASFQRLAPIVGTFFQSLVTVLGGILKAIAPIGVAMFQVISSAVTAIMPVLRAFGQVIGAIAPVVAEVAQSFAGLLGTALKGLAPIISALLPVVSQIVQLLGNGLINIFKDVQPAIGAALPVIAQLVQALAGALGPAIKDLGPLIADLSPLTFVFTPVAKAVGDLAPLFGQLASVFVELLPAVGNLIGAFLSMGGQVLGQLVPVLVQLGYTLLSNILPIIKAIIPFLPQLTQLLGVAVTGAVQALVPALQELTPTLNILVPILGQVLVFALSALVSILKEIPGPILAVGVAMLAFNPVVVGIIAGVTGLILIIKTLSENWQRIWTDIKQWFSDALNFLHSGFGALALLITGPIAPILLLALHWQQVWTDIENWTTSAVNTVSGFFTGFADDISGAAEDIYNSVTGFFSQMWEDVTSGVTSGIDSIIEFFENLPNEIFGAIQGLASGMEQVGVQIVNAIVSGIESAGSDIWNVITQSIPGGGVINDVGNFLGLATGGIVTQPTLALVGEAGPEAVIPLSGTSGVLGFDRSVTPLPSMSSVSSSPAAGSGAGVGGEVTINVQIDKQTIATAVSPEIRATLLRKGRQVVNIGLGS